MKLVSYSENGKRSVPLKPEDAGWLESIGLIYRESGEGENAEYMTTGDPKALADDDISFIEGVLYARHLCPAQP